MDRILSDKLQASESMKKDSTDPAAASRRHRRQAADRCLEAFKRGKVGELFQLLPQISILRDRRFLEPLLDMLAARSTRKREFAVLALGALQDPRALKPLFAGLNNLKANGPGSLRKLRPAVVQAMGEIGSDHAVPYIRSLLKDPSCDGDPKAWKAGLVEALGLIAQQGELQALECLMELAAGRDSRLCVYAIREIAVVFWHRPNRLPQKVLQLFADRLHDEVMEVRLAALLALQELAQLGSKKAELALRKLETGC